MVLKLVGSGFIYQLYVYFSRRLVLGYQQARVPAAPPAPDLEVCGAHAVTVKLKDSRVMMPQNPPVVTKYKGIDNLILNRLTIIYNDSGSLLRF